MTALAFLVAWLIGPTILLALWLLWPSRHTGDDAQRTARLTLLALIAVVGLGSIVFRAMVGSGLEQTAAVFVGIPTLLAAAAVFIPTTSAVGVACKAVTIGLLISILFLGEGVLCVAFSAPLFYLVALLVGTAIEAGRRDPSIHRTFLLLPLLAMPAMSLEGVTPHTTIARDNVVVTTRIVLAPADAVAASVLAPPRFDRQLPAALTWGFPRPLSTSLDGQTIHVQMRGGEMRLDGNEPRVGTLTLVREDVGPSHVSWRATADDSHMRHFLTWQSSRVEWTAVDAATTRVTWTIRYRRDLDPAWYFGPMERFAVRRAAEYLIDSVATP